jgi:nucleoside-diphosphate-sugar epimerase
VARSASILSFDKDPAKVIPPTIASITSILQSSLSEPMIKSFVFTSSATACNHPEPKQSFSIDPTLWNEEDIKGAWAPKEHWKEGHEWIVYGASKTEAEKALWKFRDEKKPNFAINSILPSTILGPVVSPKEITSTAGFIKGLYEGHTDFVATALPRSCFLSSYIQVLG